MIKLIALLTVGLLLLSTAGFVVTWLLGLVGLGWIGIFLSLPAGMTYGIWAGDKIFDRVYDE